MWRELLASWAPLYAEPRFFPDDELRRDFTQLTGIQMLTERREGICSVLNDPDTGIRLPGKKNQAERRSHLDLERIIAQLRTNGVRCVITFDQSFHRTHNLNQVEQRRAKMRFLHSKGLPSFYYASHAPFRFAAPNERRLKELRDILSRAGIPENLFESVQ